MTTPTPKAGRPRSITRERDLLIATQDLLAEVGYDRLTIDAVAAKCGAAKTTVYRRWPGKAELVTAAITQLHEVDEAPDTGDLRNDLILMAAAWLDPDSRRDRVVSGLLTAMNHDDSLRVAVLDAVAAPRGAAFHAVIDAALRRGDIDGGSDFELVGTAIPAIIFHRISIMAQPVDRSFVEHLIDSIVLPALLHPRTVRTSQPGHAPTLR